ncbi:MAG TPA: protein kinase [Gemmatimonadaceae bacterium]|nr:protein kinase [Gemmatimonadaceae bacterium]
MSHDPDADFIALQAALAGEYSLDRELGRGGMGIVYLAREVRLARPVAIKILPPELARQAELRDAFLHEAQTAARLTHPNIVPVYAAGERGGYAYIVMAYVDGITLGERIRTRGPLLPGQAARMLREVSWALAYAHAAGIVHRDVSAENILLERGTDRAIVMDFGIASAMQTSAQAADGRIMGNAHYVSPEQAAGEPLDARSDLYSLGVVGFYALTGRLPFDGSTPQVVVTRHLTMPAPPIASIATAVPARLAQAVDRCLAKDPVRRYRGAEAFAEAIDLAFEHAREIPAALRVWISQGERELPARLALVGMSAAVGVPLVIATMNSWFYLLPMSIATGVSFIPTVMRLRRVLRDGYHVDDLHAALKEHALLRSEEIEYERSQRSALTQNIMKVIFAGSVGAGLTLARLVATAPSTGHVAYGYALGLMISLSMLTLSSVSLIGDFLRLRLSARLAATSISFWKSRWGTRLARFAGIGLKTADRPALGMPLLTEVALGRATDHLFQALPKAARRELAALPGTVRRLGDDAGALRESIDALDAQLAAFDRGDDGLADAERTRVADELRSARAQAVERLAATVAAIENIRLDLLRLQMGSTGIESVTASLDAARRIGQQISEALDAQEQVERLLRRTTRDLRGPSASSIVEDDDDADTPVSGVPATRG